MSNGYLPVYLGGRWDELNDLIVGLWYRMEGHGVVNGQSQGRPLCLPRLGRSISSTTKPAKSAKTVQTDAEYDVRRREEMLGLCSLAGHC